MSDAPVREVVVLGAGLTGWTVAATIANSLRGAQVGVTLLDLRPRAREPVAVSVLPATLGFFRHLGIEESALLKNADATYRLGTQLDDWPAPGEQRVRPFGRHGADIGFIPFHHYATRARAEAGADVPFDAWSVAAVAARHRRFVHPPAEARSVLKQLDYGLCFDSRESVILLRALARSLGVRTISGELGEARRRLDDGFIESLRLVDGTEIGGDLFIDCSGPRARLIGDALGVEYRHWSDVLPCNRLLECEIEERPVIAPLTHCAARNYGWQLEYALQTRTVVACLYAADALDASSAAEDLQRRCHGAGSPTDYRISSGHRRKFWDRNCIAMGDAAGALEPLAASGFHLLQSAVSRLMRMFPDRACDRSLADEYNRLTSLEYSNLRDYLLINYHAPAVPRRQFIGDARLPETFERRRELFASTGRVVLFDEETFDRDAWSAAWISADLWPERHDPLLDRMEQPALDQHFGRMRNAIDSAVKTMPEHDLYLRRQLAETT